MWKVIGLAVLVWIGLAALGAAVPELASLSIAGGMLVFAAVMWAALEWSKQYWH